MGFYLHSLSKFWGSKQNEKKHLAVSTFVFAVSHEVRAGVLSFSAINGKYRKAHEKSKPASCSVSYIPFCSSYRAAYKFQ